MIMIVGTSLVAAVVATLLIAAYLARKSNQKDNATLSGAPVPGTLLTLSEPLLAGRGRAFVSGREWLLDGPDVDAGATVAVVAARDGKLYVMPTDDASRLPKAGTFGG